MSGLEPEVCRYRRLAAVAVATGKTKYKGYGERRGDSEPKPKHSINNYNTAMNLVPSHIYFHYPDTIFLHTFAVSREKPMYNTQNR